MEDRKKEEIKYYDKKIIEAEGERGDFEGFSPEKLSSFSFAYNLLAKYSRGKTVLDYGCGNGIHSFFPVKKGAEKVIGIDLSEESLKIAKKKAFQKGLSEKVEFLKRDCEETGFPNGYFDIVFDGGTFSSLDMEKVYSEIFRILKPGGLLIGIETFGHNPFTNLKRKINKKTGKRTAWASEHIFKEEDIEKAKKYFKEIGVKHFHLFSWAAFPLFGFPCGLLFFKSLDFLDRIILKIPFLKKYSFKIVFVFKK